MSDSDDLARMTHVVRSIIEEDLSEPASDEYPYHRREDDIIHSFREQELELWIGSIDLFLSNVSQKSISHDKRQQIEDPIPIDVY